MNLDKIRKVNEELEALPTITDKLNHWKTNYLDKYTSAELWDYFEAKSAEELNKPIGDAFEKGLYIPINESKLIPSLHTPSFAIPQNERIEYYSWMLYYLSELRFEQIVKPELQAQVKTPMGKEKLQGKYNRLKEIQINAKKNLIQGTYSIQYIEKPNDEQLYLWYADDLYSRIEIPIHNMENKYVYSVCDHKFVYPYLKSLLKIRASDNDGKITPNKSLNFDFQRLAEELCARQFFEKEDIDQFVNWCNGNNLESPLVVIKPMNHMASVIASLVENNVISNSKKECCSIIQTNFLFDGKIAEILSIENAMKPGNSNRITEFDKENYINVTSFFR